MEMSGNDVGRQSQINLNSPTPRKDPCNSTGKSCWLVEQDETYTSGLPVYSIDNLQAAHRFRRPHLVVYKSVNNMMASSCCAEASPSTVTGVTLYFPPSVARLISHAFRLLIIALVPWHPGCESAVTAW